MSVMPFYYARNASQYIHRSVIRYFDALCNVNFSSIYSMHKCVIGISNSANIKCTCFSRFFSSCEIWHVTKRDQFSFFK